MGLAREEVEHHQPELLRCYRLGERQSMPVQIHHVELDHPVLLPTKLTRNLHSRQRRALFLQRLDIVKMQERDNVWKTEKLVCGAS